MDELRVPVLIVGAGGCGLATSIFMANLGVETLTVERHAGTAVVPKARYINQRAMEIFRQHGLADEIYSRSMPLKYIQRIRWCTTLAGDGPLDRREFYKIDSFGGGALTHYAKDSPCPSTLYPQVRLEPLLRAEAERRSPGRVLYNHELTDIEQDAEGVTATVCDRLRERAVRVRADYVVGADGGKTVGSKVGVEIEGPTNLAEVVTVYFKADLSRYWDDDYAMTTWFVNPEGGSWASGVLGKLGPTRFDRHSEEWMFHFSFRPDDPARHNEEALVPRIRELLRIPDLNLEVIRIGRWVVEGVLAHRFRFGRIFLAGDAAHRHPPTTGLGLNSAIQDAHNLAWKLALVLRGVASDALLDTYETERRPVTAYNVKWALMTFSNHALTDGIIGHVRGDPVASRANFEAFFSETEEGRTRRARLDAVMQIQRMEWQAHDIELGYHYEQGAVVPDGTLAPKRDPLGGLYVPTTRPGHRLPHAWVTVDGVVKSTHDLASPGGFLLITGRDAEVWRRAAGELAPRLDFPLDVVTLDEDDLADADRNWVRHRGISAEGAVLVRPDNHVGWRSSSAGADSLLELRDALARILGVSAGKIEKAAGKARGRRA